MKKIFTLLLATFFSLSLMGQERELSDYEKYRMQKEKEEHYTLYESDTVKKDSVYVEVESEPVVINNYYVDNEPNLRFNLTFGYHWRPYYYDPFYCDWYYYGWN